MPAGSATAGRRTPQRPREERQLVERAIDLGGTTTGEHGIGIGKRDHLAEEYDDATVDAMRAIKVTLDPNDILNPGKIFPDDEET